MLKYLSTFPKTIGFSPKETRTVTALYRAVLTSWEANRAFNSILAEYEEDPSAINYRRIDGRLSDISRLTGQHRYLVDLVIYLALSRHLETVYEEKGLPKAVFLDSMRDLKYKCDECRLVYGEIGTFVGWWFDRFFIPDRFAFGRLQFEIVPFGHEYRDAAVHYTKDTPAINVHIPRSGEPLTSAACDDAFARARAFFGDEYRDAPFVCDSWLLYPENEKILPTTSRIRAFIKRFRIIESRNNRGDDLWRLFDTKETDPDKLPADTSLRRAYIAHLKRGGKVGEGFGFIPPEMDLTRTLAKNGKERKILIETKDTTVVDYTKLKKLIKKRRMTLSSFAKKAGLSRADLYALEIGGMLSIEGEVLACMFFDCDCCDIRDVIPGESIKRMIEVPGR